MSTSKEIQKIPKATDAPKADLTAEPDFIKNIPKIAADALIHTYKAGGLALCFLLIAFVILCALIDDGALGKIVNLVSYFMIFLLVAALLMFVVTAVFAHLEAQAKFRAELEKFRLQSERKSTVESRIFEYATTLAKSPSSTEAQRSMEIQIFLDKLKTFMASE